MNTKHIGFWKWLYETIKDGARDALIMSSLIGELGLAIMSLVFGIREPLVFVGVPVGILLFLYAVYQINENAPSTE